MSCILEIVNILSETNCVPLNNALKTLPKPHKMMRGASLNSDLTEPNSLSRNPSANHTRTESTDLNFDETLQSSPSLPPTPTLVNPIIESGMVPILLDPISPRPIIPAITKLINHNNGPPTPAVQGRNHSPIPTLAPPTARSQNDHSSDTKPNDCPKREDIAMSILTVLLLYLYLLIAFYSFLCLQAVLPWVVESCCDDIRFASHLQGVLCAFQALCKVLSSPNFTFDIDINMRFSTCLHMVQINSF